MRRFLCLHFPRWPIQCLRLKAPETRGAPAILFSRSAHGPVLVSCSVEAQRLGVRQRMPLADATALTPDLSVHEADRCADLETLKKVALWASQFSPLVAVEAECAAVSHAQALLLDITGCEQVFKGEHNLLEQAVRALAKRRFKARAAIASTIGAAWALAHYAHSSAIVPDEPAVLRQTLSALPLPSLRLDAEAVACLNKLGLQRIGQVLDQPRSTLPSRFGPSLIERLDQALGIVPENIAWLRPPPDMHLSRAFEYPLKDSEVLLRVLEKMTVELARELKRRNRGARQIECWLYPEVADPVCVELVLFKGTASAKHLARLLRTRLEQLPRMLTVTSRRTDDSFVEASNGISVVALRVTATDTLDAGQMELFAKSNTSSADSNEGLSQTLEHIAMRLGPSSVLRAHLKADAQPEHACVLTSLRERRSSDETPVPPTDLGPRPLRLLPEPVPIGVEFDSLAPPQRVSRGVVDSNQVVNLHPGNALNPTCASIAATMSGFNFQRERIAVAGIAGPERIETGWWRDAPARRDYYVVDAETGSRYWIFQRLDDHQWFLHGLFD